MATKIQERPLSFHAALANHVFLGRTVSVSFWLKSVFGLWTALLLSWLLAHAALAQANCAGVACVSSGPRLASLDTQQSVLLDALLGDLLGVDLNLSVADANALAQGEIGLVDLLDGLHIDLNVATAADVLTTDVTIGQVLAAVAAVSNDTATINALNGLAATPNLPTATIQLGDLLQVDSAPESLSNINLNVLDLLTGSIQLFNHDNLVATPSPITLSGAALGLEGILNTVTLRAQVIEPPLYVCGKAGAQFFAAALRLQLGLDLVDIPLDTTALENTLKTGLGALVTVDVNAAIGQVDLAVVVGRGTGTITQLNAVSEAVTVQATPGVVDLYLGTIDDTLLFDRSHIISATTDLDFATLGNVAITLTTAGIPVVTAANLEAKSFATGDNPTAVTLNFAAPYPQTQTATTSESFTTDLVTELMTNLQLHLSSSLGATLDPLINSTILPAIATLATDNLDSPLAALFNGTADPLLTTLGIGLGEMAVTVHGVAQECDTDSDNIVDALDSDDDGDGIRDVDEGNGAVNSDNDATPDAYDSDSDNDGLPDATEGHDADHNGQPDRAPSGQDANHNGLDDAFDPDQNGVVAPLPDTDGDHKPDFQDADDDGDGISTANEDTDHNGSLLNDDSDGDGRLDYLDPANNNPCVPNTNATACQNDTDGDGTPNNSDPAPTDPCNPNANAVTCSTGDTDNDDTPNGDDAAPTDPCVPNANAVACATGDADSDGTPNGNDPAPTNPCVPNANAAACQSDRDGDGVGNDDDSAPDDPCVPNVNAVACSAGDADGDETPNGSDPAPLNPCVPNSNVVACATGDADRDGIQNGSDSAPTNPCIPNANAVACTTGDADQDTVANGDDPAPLNPCLPNANAIACTTGDADDDGTLNGSDPAPLNPCIPDNTVAACTRETTDGFVYLPVVIK
ncbi:MAG: hypothetical protein R3C14_12700 [Caldilineaceae bacterium]